MMDEDRMAFWAKVMLLALVVDCILLIVDNKMKNDVIKESRELRELINNHTVVVNVRGREAGPDQSPRSGKGAGPDPVVPVVDDPPAPPPAVADAGPADPGKVDGIGSPPHRGGIHAG